MEEKETIRPIEITWEELQSRDLDRYILVDTRGDEAVNYGMIPGAIAIPECELIDRLAAAAGDKKVILYCSRGQNSRCLQSISENREWRPTAYRAAIPDGC